MIKRKGSIELSGLSRYGNNAYELAQALQGIPPGATYDIHHSQGDRPWESDTYSITIEWDES
jgi:hypothetical protein